MHSTLSKEIIYNTAFDLKHQFGELLGEWLPRVPPLQQEWNFLLYMSTSWIFFFLTKKAKKKAHADWQGWISDNQRSETCCVRNLCQNRKPLLTHYVETFEGVKSTY